MAFNWLESAIHSLSIRIIYIYIYAVPYLINTCILILYTLNTSGLAPAIS